MSDDLFSMAEFVRSQLGRMAIATAGPEGPVSFVMERNGCLYAYGDVLRELESRIAARGLEPGGICLSCHLPYRGGKCPATVADPSKSAACESFAEAGQ